MLKKWKNIRLILTFLNKGGFMSKDNNETKRVRISNSKRTIKNKSNSSKSKS